MSGKFYCAYCAKDVPFKDNADWKRLLDEHFSKECRK